MCLSAELIKIEDFRESDGTKHGIVNDEHITRYYAGNSARTITPVPIVE